MSEIGTYRAGSDRGRLSPVSYDLMLVEKRPDEDWEAALDRLGSGAGTDRELSTQRRALWERVAARLVELDGEFERFDGPGFIELSHDELGIQVSLFEDEGAVTIPYWYEGDAARTVMQQVADVVDAVREVSGWAVWDPQLDRGLESGRALLDQGPTTMSTTARRLSEILEAPRKPWWKFWAR